MEFTGTLSAVDCVTCYATFGMTKDSVRRLKSTHESFYCPYCRAGQSWQGMSDEEHLLDKVASLEKRLVAREACLDRVRAGHEHEKRRAATYKGQVTKIKKRVGQGVCPCCNRSFRDLAEHMKAMHPDFAGEDVADG